MPKKDTILISYELRSTSDNLMEPRSGLALGDRYRAHMVGRSASQEVVKYQRVRILLHRFVARSPGGMPLSGTVNGLQLCVDIAVGPHAAQSLLPPAQRSYIPPGVFFCQFCGVTEFAQICEIQRST